MPRPRKADRGLQTVARLVYRPDSGASMCAPELDEALDAWACGTLWNAVWDPGVLTVAEADAARHWLDRMDRADMDPAADCLLETFRLLVEDGDG